MCCKNISRGLCRAWLPTFTFQLTTGKLGPAVSMYQTSEGFILHGMVHLDELKRRERCRPKYDQNNRGDRRGLPVLNTMRSSFDVRSLKFAFTEPNCERVRCRGLGPKHYAFVAFFEERALELVVSASFVLCFQSSVLKRAWKTQSNFKDAAIKVTRTCKTALCSLLTVDTQRGCHWRSCGSLNHAVLIMSRSFLNMLGFKFFGTDLYISVCAQKDAPTFWMSPPRSFPLSLCRLRSKSNRAGNSSEGL